MNLEIWILFLFLGGAVEPGGVVGEASVLSTRSGVYLNGIMMKEIRTSISP